MFLENAEYLTYQFITVGSIFYYLPITYNKPNSAKQTIHHELIRTASGHCMPAGLGKKPSAPDSFPFVISLALPGAELLDGFHEGFVTFD